jgi:hypothetical protein
MFLWVRGWSSDQMVGGLNPVNFVDLSRVNAVSTASSQFCASVGYIDQNLWLNVVSDKE